MEAQFPQVLVDAIVQVLPVIVGIISVWLLGQITGLWELIKDENIRRLASRGLRMFVDTELDEYTEAYINKTSETLVTYIEGKLKAKGIQVELDDIAAIVTDATSDFFDYLRSKSTEVSYYVDVEDDDDQDNLDLPKV